MRCEAMRAEANGALPEAISGISIDSRTLQPGEAYFAIRGAVHDGHNFVAAALKAGAALAVVEKAQAGKFESNAPLLVVDDVLGALVDLARASRARSQAQVIAVTGSVGKTSTKEALLHVLSAQGEPMPRRRPSTIIGACRCRWRAARRTRNLRCSRSG